MNPVRRDPRAMRLGTGGGEGADRRIMQPCGHSPGDQDRGR
jgi:hypothetical protein